MTFLIIALIVVVNLPRQLIATDIFNEDMTMPKHTVEIPKGTVIKINDEIKILTKGIRLAQKGNDLVVVDFA